MFVYCGDKEELKGKDIRGGQGEAFSRLLLGKGLDDQSPLRAVAVNRLPVGASWGQIPVKHQEEIFVILQGKAEVTIDGEAATLGPNDLSIATNRQTLAIRNAGSDELVWLGIVVALKRSIFADYNPSGRLE